MGLKTHLNVVGEELNRPFDWLYHYFGPNAFLVISIMFAVVGVMTWKNPGLSEQYEIKGGLYAFGLGAIAYAGMFLDMKRRR